MLRRLALAATAATLFAAPAMATEYRIPVNTLDTAQGAARFEKQLRRVGRNICSHLTGVSRTSCRAGVHQEALSQLPPPLRLSFNQARNRAPIKNAALLTANAR